MKYFRAVKTKANYDGNRPWECHENLGICSQFDLKSKTCFFYFPRCVYFLNRTGQNSNLTVFISRIQVFCRPEWAKVGTPRKFILIIFKWKNEFLKQLGLEKQMKKMGSFVWFSCLLFGLWSLSCPVCVFSLISATNLRLL